MFGPHTGGPGCLTKGAGIPNEGLALKVDGVVDIGVLEFENLFSRCNGCF